MSGWDLSLFEVWYKEVNVRLHIWKGKETTEVQVLEKEAGEKSDPVDGGVTSLHCESRKRKTRRLRGTYFYRIDGGKLKESASLMAWFSHWSKMSDENEEKEEEGKDFEIKMWVIGKDNWREYYTLIKWGLMYTCIIQKLSWFCLGSCLRN